MSAKILILPVPCFADRPLREAEESYNNGDDIRAGEQLGEALRQFLESCCEDDGLFVSDDQPRTNRDMIKLRRTVDRWDIIELLHSTRMIAERAAGQRLKNREHLRVGIILLWDLFSGTAGEEPEGRGGIVFPTWEKGGGA